MKVQTETDKLIDMALFFCGSEANKCWPTVKRWTILEAKKVIQAQARKARDELRVVTIDHEDGGS